jgi:hypothetical protein
LFLKRDDVTEEIPLPSNWDDLKQVAATRFKLSEDVRNVPVVVLEIWEIAWVKDMSQQFNLCYYYIGDYKLQLYIINEFRL